MVHAIRLLTANGFAQKANLATDYTDNTDYKFKVVLFEPF
jgi:hypothetical protein